MVALLSAVEQFQAEEFKQCLAFVSSVELNEATRRVVKTSCCKLGLFNSILLCCFRVCLLVVENGTGVTAVVCERGKDCPKKAL